MGAVFGAGFGGAGYVGAKAWKKAFSPKIGSDLTTGKTTPEMIGYKQSKFENDLLVKGQSPDLKPLDDLHNAMKTSDYEYRQEVLSTKRTARDEIAASRQVITETANRQDLRDASTDLGNQYDSILQSTEIELSNYPIRDLLTNQFDIPVKERKGGGGAYIDLGFKKIDLPDSIQSFASLNPEGRAAIAQFLAKRDVTNGSISEQFQGSVSSDYIANFEAAKVEREATAKAISERDGRLEAVKNAQSVDELNQLVDKYKDISEGEFNDFIDALDAKQYQFENPDAFKKFADIKEFETFDNLTNEQKGYLEDGRLDEFADDRGYTPEQKAQFLEALDPTKNEVLLHEEFKDLVDGDPLTVKRVMDAQPPTKTAEEILENMFAEQESSAQKEALGEIEAEQKFQEVAKQEVDIQQKAKEQEELVNMLLDELDETTKLELEEFKSELDADEALSNLEADAKRDIAICITAQFMRGAA
jgi:hypothetical protein